MNRKETGAVYEQAAAEYLEQQGYSEIARRSRYGEIDLVAEEAGTLVFVEVKIPDGRNHSVSGGSRQSEQTEENLQNCRLLQAAAPDSGRRSLPV